MLERNCQLTAHVKIIPGELEREVVADFIHMFGVLNIIFIKWKQFLLCLFSHIWKVHMTKPNKWNKSKR